MPVYLRQLKITQPCARGTIQLIVFTGSAREAVMELYKCGPFALLWGRENVTACCADYKV